MHISSKFWLIFRHSEMLRPYGLIVSNLAPVVFLHLGQPGGWGFLLPFNDISDMKMQRLLEMLKEMQSMKAAAKSPDAKP